MNKVKENVIYINLMSPIFLEERYEFIAFTKEHFVGCELWNRNTLMTSGDEIIKSIIDSSPKIEPLNYEKMNFKVDDPNNIVLYYDLSQNSYLIVSIPFVKSFEEKYPKYSDFSAYESFNDLLLEKDSASKHFVINGNKKFAYLQGIVIPECLSLYRFLGEMLPICPVREYNEKGIVDFMVNSFIKDSSLGISFPFSLPGERKKIDSFFRDSRILNSFLIIELYGFTGCSMSNSSFEDSVLFVDKGVEFLYRASFKNSSIFLDASKIKFGDIERLYQISKEGNNKVYIIKEFSEMCKFFDKQKKKKIIDNLDKGIENIVFQIMKKKYPLLENIVYSVEN